MAGIIEAGEPRPSQGSDDNGTGDSEARSLRSHDSSGSDCPSTSDRASTKSVTRSVLEEQIENGRRYANDEYFMPDDEDEETRLAITHQAYLLILDNKLTLSHIPYKTKRILDLGTGPGDWAIAMGERHPDIQIVATDISPSYQPAAVTPNVVFQIDDARAEWTYTKPFDFIHIRGLAGAFSDWSRIYAEAFKHLAPDGIVEVADFGLVNVPDASSYSYVSIFNGACESAAEKAGTSLGVAHLRKQVLEQAGFSVARSKGYEVPLGNWSPDPAKRVIGKMALISVLEGLEAMGLRLLTRELGWTVEEVRDLCGKVRREVTAPGVRASIPCQFVVARKIVVAD